VSVWNPKQSKILASFFGVVTRTLPPSSLLREKTIEFSFFNEIQLYERDQLHQRGEPCDERTNERTNARRRKTRDVPFVAREVGGDARWFPSRRLVVVCFLFLFLRERIGNAKTSSGFVTSSVFVPLLFVSSPREKTSADQRNRNARREVGEKMMRPKRAARKKNKVSSRTLSFERIRCARFEGVFCARKVEQRVVESARACVWRKKYYGEIVSPHSHKKKEKKISWSFFCPFFAPFLALFFSHLFFFRSRFPLFWREGKSFTEFRVLVFPIVLQHHHQATYVLMTTYYYVFVLKMRFETRTNYSSLK